MGISDIFSDIKDDINTKIMLNTFKKYLESQKIKYEVKEGFVHFKVQLDNRLKSVKFKMLFSGALVYVTVTIIDSTPREFGLAIERYLELMNQKNIWTEGKYTYYPEFDGPIVLTSDKYYCEGDRDDFLKECLDVPLKILEADGDSLYEFIHSLKDGSSSTIVGLGEVPKKGEAKEKGEASSSLGVRMAATMDREGEESRQGQGQAKETLALPPAPSASPNPSGVAGKKKTRGKKDVKGVVTAFKEYMYRNGMFFSDAKKDEVECIFDLKNKLKTQKFSIIFHAEDHVEVTTRLKDVPLKCGKEEFNKYKDYLQLKFAKCEWVFGMYMSIGVCIYWTIPFGVLSDDSIRHCLSVPVDTLKSIGDDLYDLLNTEPAVDAANELNESKKEDFEWTTPHEAMEMVQGWMDEKGYSYKVTDGEVPQLEASFRLFRLNGKVEVIGLFFYFYKTGLLIHATICNHFVPEGNRDRMAVELNQWNFGNVFRGSYEMKNSNGAMTYRYSIEYGESIRLPQETLDRGIRACVHAWDEVPENILRLMEDSQTTSENTTDPPSGKSEKGGKDASSAKDGSVGSGQAEPQGTSVPEAMEMVKQWMKDKGYRIYQVSEGDLPEISLALSMKDPRPKNIDEIKLYFYFYKFGIMVSTAVNGSTVPEEDRERMLKALNDWNVRKTIVGNYELSNKTGEVRFRFFIHYSDKIKLTQEMVDKVCWLANGAWDKPPEEVLKLLRVPERRE